MAGELIQEERKLENGWTVWMVRSRIDLKTADEVYKRGEEIIAKSDKTALDISGVEYLSSAGIRAMLRLNKLARKSSKEFTVVGANGMPKAVLEDSGMDVLLKAKESVDELI